MSENLICTICNTETVNLKSNPKGGAALWHCLKCGELRYWCPACDQGWVVHAILKNDETHIYLCEECETMWLSVAQIGSEKCTNFSSFMESKLLRALWSEIEIKRDFE